MFALPDPQQRIAAMPLEKLTDVLNDAASYLTQADMGHPAWKVYSLTSREVYSRLAPHYGAAPDEELAGVLLMHISKPSRERTGLAEVVAGLVEDELRSRFSEASELSDEVLATMDFEDPQRGEFEYLWVLLRASGVSF